MQLDLESLYLVRTVWATRFHASWIYNVLLEALPGSLRRYTSRPVEAGYLGLHYKGHLSTRVDVFLTGFECHR